MGPNTIIKLQIPFIIRTAPMILVIPSQGPEPETNIIPAIKSTIANNINNTDTLSQKNNSLLKIKIYNNYGL